MAKIQNAPNCMQYLIYNKSFKSDYLVYERYNFGNIKNGTNNF